MERSETYNTKQKEKLLQYIEKIGREFTIKDIHEENKDIGLTTIYRLVDKLIKEEKIAKSVGKNNNIYYRYLEECDNKNHFYLKCDNCGSMIHIDCDCITELSDHILEKHKFIPNNKNIVINGICKNCTGKGVL